MVGNHIFVPTDEGIVRLDLIDDSLVQTHAFLDTATFVDMGSQLQLGKNGIYAINERDIYLLNFEG